MEREREMRQCTRDYDLMAAHGLELGVRPWPPQGWQVFFFTATPGWAAIPGMSATLRSNLPLQWHVMESLPQFSKLRAALVKDAKVPWRQILSHHTSSPCQPQKSAGPVASLKACGMDTPEKMGQGEYRVMPSALTQKMTSPSTFTTPTMSGS